MGTQILEYNLDMYDTPGVRRFVIEGKIAKPIGIVIRGDEIFLQIEHTNGAGKWHDIRVEIHGTGWPIPFVDDVTYVGTGNVYDFVWHVFYTTHVSDYDPTNIKQAKQDETDVNARENDEQDAGNIRMYTIYKYPIADSGSTELHFEYKFVRVLYIGEQRGQRMAWILHELVKEETTYTLAEEDTTAG